MLQPIRKANVPLREHGVSLALSVVRGVLGAAT
jgi:hypothetical protein